MKEKKPTLRRLRGSKGKASSYDKSANSRGGPHLLPIEVPYDVLEDAASMRRFLKDLIAWTLGRRILPRQASACRACVETSLRVDEHEVLERLEKRLADLEAAQRVRVH